MTAAVVLGEVGCCLFSPTFEVPLSGEVGLSGSLSFSLFCSLARLPARSLACSPASARLRSDQDLNFEVSRGRIRILTLMCPEVGIVFTFEESRGRIRNLRFRCPGSEAHGRTRTRTRTRHRCSSRVDAGISRIGDHFGVDAGVLHCCLFRVILLLLGLWCMHYLRSLLCCALLLRSVTSSSTSWYLTILSLLCCHGGFAAHAHLWW